MNAVQTRSASEELRGFSLIELLAAIAIIGVLIALLAALLAPMRRRVSALGAPLAYLGNDRRIHLADPSGKADRDLGGNLAAYDGLSEWSPRGAWIIGDRITEAKPVVRSYMLVQSPATGQVGNHPMPDIGTSGQVFNGWSGSLMVGWADDHSYYVPDRGTVGGAGELMLELRDADSGTAIRTIPMPGVPASCKSMQLTPLPIVAGAGYISSDRKSVMLRRKDLSPGRVIWKVPGQDDAALRPLVDPLGEWVAWTEERCRPEKPGSMSFNCRYGIALKRLKSGASTPPTMLGQQFEHSIFCDWTDDGRMLVNISDKGTWSLAILGTDGSLVRRISTQVPPEPASYASWRKYGPH